MNSTPPSSGGVNRSTVKQWRDTHRQREKDAIRSLDHIAAAEHLAKRARLRADETRQRRELHGQLRRPPSGKRENTRKQPFLKGSACEVCAEGS